MMNEILSKSKDEDGKFKETSRYRNTESEVQTQLRKKKHREAQARYHAANRNLLKLKSWQYRKVDWYARFGIYTELPQEVKAMGEGSRAGRTQVRNADGTGTKQLTNRFITFSCFPFHGHTWHYLLQYNNVHTDPNSFLRCADHTVCTWLRAINAKFWRSHEAPRRAHRRYIDMGVG